LASAKLASKKTGFEARKELRFLQSEWKNVGKTTGNLSRSLNEEFKRINNQVFKGSSTTSSQSSSNGLNVGEILKAKRDMIDRVTALSEIDSPTSENVEEVKTLQREWKNKGILPKEHNKPMSEAFYSG